MVATFEGYVPAQTRPYGYGNNYLEIIQGGLGGILLNLPPKL